MSKLTKGKGAGRLAMMLAARALVQKRQGINMIDRGELKFDHKRGWVPGTSPDAKINIRARAAAEDPNPETNFARKDRDTLLRSMTKSAPGIRKMREMLCQMKTRAQVMQKQDGENPAIVSIRNAFGFSRPAPPPPPPPPPPESPNTGSLAGNISAGLSRLMGKSNETPAEEVHRTREDESRNAGQKDLKKGCDGIEILRKLTALAKMRKTNVPHPPESAEDKAHDVVEGQQSLKSALKEGLSPEEQRRMLEHMRSAKADPRSKINRAAGADVPGVVGKSECMTKQTQMSPSCGFRKSKWPVPGLVPPSGDKGKGGQQPLNKVYASEAQRRFFHSAGAKKAGITDAQVKEFDEASKGKDLPERVSKADHDDQRVAAYAKKLLGSFANGKMLYNTAGHPDHAEFDVLDHMRAAAIHSKMAAEAEKGKQYLEAAHHRKQAAHHRAKWKAQSPNHAGSLYKSLMDATRNKGSSPMRDGLNTGEETAVEKKSLTKDEKKPNLKIVPHPDKVVDSKGVANMNQRPKPSDSLANTMRLLGVVKKLTSGERPMEGREPPFIDDEFKAKLNGILKKAQYAKTGDPEDRKKALKEEKIKGKAMKQLGEQLRRDAIKYLKNQKGDGLASDNPGSKDRAKLTRRNLKDVKPGEQLNKPE